MFMGDEANTNITNSCLFMRDNWENFIQTSHLHSGNDDRTQYDYRKWIAHEFVDDSKHASDT